MITFPTGSSRLAHDPAYTELYTGPYEDTVTGKEWRWNDAKQRWQPFLQTDANSIITNLSDLTEDQITAFRAVLATAGVALNPL